MGFIPPHCELCGRKADEYVTTSLGITSCWDCLTPDERGTASAKLGVKVSQRPWPGQSNRERNLLYRNRFLQDHPCADCGEFRMEVLEFDHIPERGPKYATVSALVYKGVSLARLQAEMDKCEVVCCSCHKLRTDKRRTPGAKSSAAYRSRLRKISANRN